MHPLTQATGLMEVASQAQTMSRNAHQEKMGVAFQTVAMVSMAIMGATAAAHLIRDLRRHERGRG